MPEFPFFLFSTLFVLVLSGKFISISEDEKKWDLKKPSATKSDLEKFFDNHFTQKLMTEFQLSGVAVSFLDVSNQVSFFKGYGFEDYESNTSKVSETTVFQHGSASQLLIGLSSVLVFSQEELESINAEAFFPKINLIKNMIIGNYESQNGYPYFHTNSNISLIQLLTHSAGLDKQSLYGGRGYNSLRQDLMYNFPDRIRENGRVCSENEFGIAAAALSVELNNEKNYSYFQFLKEKIFSPLGIENIYYGYKDAKKNSKNLCRFSFLYQGEYMDYPLNMNINNHVKPTSDIYISHKDLKILVKAILEKNEKIMQKEKYEYFLKTHFSIEESYTKGINIILEKQSLYDYEWLMKSTKNPPFHSCLYINKEKQIALMMNLVGTVKGSEIEKNIIENFTIKFLKNETYCENKNKKYGGQMIIRDGNCFGKFKVNSYQKWNNSFNSVSMKKYIGCYRPTKAYHSTWIKIVEVLNIATSSLCVTEYENRFLRLEDYSENKNITEKTYLLLPNIFVDDKKELNNFLVGEIVEVKGKDIYVEISFSDTFPFSFFSRNGSNYWMKSKITETFEYASTEIEMIYAIILTCIIGFPILFLLNSCVFFILGSSSFYSFCSCNCCKRDITREYESLNEYNSFTISKKSTQGHHNIKTNGIIKLFEADDEIANVTSAITSTSDDSQDGPNILIDSNSKIVREDSHVFKVFNGIFFFLNLGLIYFSNLILVLHYFLIISCVLTLNRNYLVSSINPYPMDPPLQIPSVDWVWFFHGLSVPLNIISIIFMVLSFLTFIFMMALLVVSIVVDKRRREVTSRNKVKMFQICSLLVYFVVTVIINILYYRFSYFYNSFSRD